MYTLGTFCNERGGFYSFENNSLMVTPPMLTGTVFDCPAPPEPLTSFNDTSGFAIFSLMIEKFSMDVFSTQLNDDVLLLNAADGTILLFRECITDCFVQI